MSYKHKHGWRASAKNKTKNKRNLQAQNTQAAEFSNEQINIEILPIDPYKAEKKRQREKIKRLDNLMRKMSHQSIAWNEFRAILEDIYPEIESFIDWHTCRALGCDCELQSDGMVYLNTRARKLSEQKFCVVDIEANNSDAGGQILEIGAVMVQNGQILSEFNSLIYAPFVSQKIVELTGITSDMLKNAPKIDQVLFEFREFLGDAIFVAHGVEFDYGSVAKNCLDKISAPLLNRRICTLKLAQKYIKSPGYSLKILKEFLGIKGTDHRALDDARAAAAVLNRCLEKLKQKRFSVEDLLAF